MPENEPGSDEPVNQSQPAPTELPVQPSSAPEPAQAADTVPSESSPFVHPRLENIAIRSSEPPPRRPEDEEPPERL